MKEGQLEVFICVTGESSSWFPPLFNPRIACHSFLTEFFLPFFSFFFSFLSIHSPLISHLSLTSSLFSFYISCNLITSPSLSLVVFDDIRSSLFYNVSFSSPLFAVSFTHVHIHARFILHSLYSGHTKTNCHSIRPLFEA